MCQTEGDREIGIQPEKALKTKEENLKRPWFSLVPSGKHVVRCILLFYSGQLHLFIYA